ncbi:MULTISPECIES: Crp/Fnr family transcriptional regulator [Spirosoma]|uniref:Crp/Fnr family transcriptional regulator n=1 Tax=Spirosoma sordidisoli TaxID=2502893 RepID=A0A4Q2UNU7_9BACT|nr:MULTISPECIES: Crp/Fnr family transcriptional regulator [Spirosoma]RYC71094.1 Crp/Fnr family transcriptional regulator [Spirosoma sordidisoli]
MVDPLEAYIRARISPNDTQLTDVLSAFVTRKVRRGEMLLQAGEVCQYCYFVAKGCIQVFVSTNGGTETSRDFVFENNWLTDIYGFANQQASQEFFRAVEPTVVRAIHRDQFGRMQQQVPQFEQIYRQILEQSYATTVYRVNTFMALDALDRVRWLMQHQPRILSRLSNKLVASYLGISPETLSRLKARL